MRPVRLTRPAVDAAGAVQPSFQYLHRLPPQEIPGHKSIHPSSVLAVNTVIEPALSVAVRVDHLLRAVLLRHVRKAAALLQNAGGRIVQEHDESVEAVGSGQFEGFPEPPEFPLDQLRGVFLSLLVPARDPPAAVKVERALKCESLGRDQGKILIDRADVLLELSELAAFCPLKMRAGKKYLSGVTLFRAVQNTEQSCFPGTGRMEFQWE